MKKPSIVFFGTGPVAAKTLKEISEHFDVEAVITKPIPLHHKGIFPVHQVASENKLRVLECKNKQALDDLITTKPFNGNLGLVVDYGIIISQNVIDYFPLGIINSHFSLLPEWRGADPITFSLLSGQDKTGVSLMLIVKELDEGPLLAQEDYIIEKDTNIQQLTEDLTNLSIKMLIQYIPEYIEGNIKPYNQNKAFAPTYSRLITKEDSFLDLTKPAEALEREIRAYLGWPGSKTTLKLNNGDPLELTVTDANVIKEHDHSPLTFKTSKGYLKITKLKLPGKQEMTAKDFLNGYGSKLN